MPNGVFTASVMPDVLRRVDELFVAPSALQAEYEHPVMTAKLLLERQNTRTEPILQGKVCKGVTAWFLQGGADFITHDGTTPRTTANCDIAAGTQMQTNGKTYDNNLNIEGVLEVDDGKCDNQLMFEEEVATGLLKVMQGIRVRLNKRCQELLEANVQPHQTGLTLNTNIIAGNATYNPNAYKIAPANFNYTTLLEMQLMATYEQVSTGVDDRVILNIGRNFWLDERVAFYKRTTTTDNDQFQVYNREDIHWDIVNANQLATPRDTTFVFNPNQMLFWNTTLNDSFTPIQVDPQNNRWEYKIEDPMLMYRENGRLVPLVYDVTYEFVCTGKTSLGKRKYTHKYEVILSGRLDIAPAGFNRATPSVAELTGIIEFVAEA